MAAMEDPFHFVRQEVQRAVNSVNELFRRWEELLKNPSATGQEEYNWTTTELKNNIRSIEWDLEDLEETISIVEANPLKFQLTPADIASRRDFIKNTKERIRAVKDAINSPAVKAKLEHGNRNNLLASSKNHNGNKYSRLDKDMEKANQTYIEDQRHQQQILMTQQDTQLEHVGQSVGVLKSMGHRIGEELDDQAVILDNIGHEIEQTDSKLQTVLLRVEKVLRLADDKKQTYVLVALIVLMIIVVILFVTL